MERYAIAVKPTDGLEEYWRTRFDYLDCAVLCANNLIADKVYLSCRIKDSHNTGEDGDWLTVLTLSS